MAFLSWLITPVIYQNIFPSASNVCITFYLTSLRLDISYESNRQERPLLHSISQTS